MNKTNAEKEYRPLGVKAAALKAMGDRAYQEDTYIILERVDDKAVMAMVADGMGGMQDGRHASRTAVGMVKNAFLRAEMNGDMNAQLRDALIKANDALYSELRGEGGTTGIACVFKDGKMYYAGVGDSFLMLRRGQVIYHLNLRQNLYYSLLTDLVRRGKTNRARAERHPEKNALVGYLGMKELINIDSFYRPLPLMYGDAVLICSDGVGDVLSDEELMMCLAASTPEEACRRLDEKIIAADRRHQDNYTAIVVKCE